MEERRRVVRAQLGEMGSNLGRFGRDFVSNTTELFEQVQVEQKPTSKPYDRSYVAAIPSVGLLLSFRSYSA